ncbi:hypothetical protein HK15_01320 [Acetobacter orientalis]|uniref:Uncharacterized protein n=1 Tax=Acetobacter orientalis TaxID=146474 RepID=A0A252B039_9PROT|nr:hypothetical protein HK15_01320 [Acetobacter orientalis]
MPVGLGRLTGAFALFRAGHTCTVLAVELTNARLQYPMGQETGRGLYGAFALGATGLMCKQ